MQLFSERFAHYLVINCRLGSNLEYGLSPVVETQAI
jgi:hypothetical protein